MNLTQTDIQGILFARSVGLPIAKVKIVFSHISLSKIRSICVDHGLLYDCGYIVYNESYNKQNAIKVLVKKRNSSIRKADSYDQMLRRYLERNPQDTYTKMLAKVYKSNKINV